MRNNIILALSALVLLFGVASCEKYKSDEYDLNNGRTANYITIPVDAWQTDTLQYSEGDTINSEGTAILSSRVSFPDTLTATLVLHAAVANVPDITYTRTLLPQRNSWITAFPIPANYLPTGVDSSEATLRLVSVSGPTTGSLKIGYLPGDNATIPLMIYR